ncbi:unnamed protein product, partial [Hapterophycus canaliculatus]
MSDGALQKLVSRLVEVGGVGDDADTTSELQSPRRPAEAEMGEHVTADSEAAESSGDEELLGAATGQPIWPSSSVDQPSPIQAPGYVRSPRGDGYDREADLLASADASECSSEGEGYAEEPSLGMAALTAAGDGDGDAGADSCGYEGDVGEGEKKKSSASFRRAAGIAPPGASAKTDGAEEADDEASGKEATKPHAHHHHPHHRPLGLDATAKEASRLGLDYHFGAATPRLDEESPWDALNESLREEGFREVALSRPGGSTTVPDPASVADALRDLVSRHGERGKAIQEMSLELQRRENVSGHRESVLNESFRRENSDLSRRSAGAEARVAALEEERERLRDQLVKETRRSKAESASLASQLKQSEHRVRAREAAVQKLTDKLREEAEKERLTQQRERAMLLKFQQRGDAFRGGGGRGGSNESSVAESLIAHSRAKERSEAEIDELRAEVLRLGDELREKENTILKHRLGPDWTPGLDGGGVKGKGDPTADELRGLRDRLAESERSARVMRQREARVLERCAAMEKECAEVQAKVDETQ